MSEPHTGTVSELAQQVAHDIGSPLAALSMILHELDPLPENVRILMRSAIHRMGDIANQLIVTNLPIKKGIEASPGHLSCSDDSTSTVLISAAIESILSEKRI